MRDLALYFIAAPVVFYFAYRCGQEALRIVRQDAKETAALRYAEESTTFAVALLNVKGLKGGVSATPPWHRPECGGPV